MDNRKVEILVGPPGTGKTTRAIGFVEDELAAGTPPNRIGFISFTKKAAEEGKSRAVEKFGLPPEDFPHFKTIHAIAFRHLGMRREQVLGWQHIRELGKIMGIDFKGKEVADDDVYGMNAADRMLFLEGLARSRKQPLKKIWNDAFEDSIDWFELERFARGLSGFKLKRGLSDYTDMLERFCACPSATLPKFKLLVIDEAQDLSPLQWDAVELMAESSERVVVLGDDLQAIYTWSGADVERFVNLPGKVSVLDQSHRVPSAVHKVAAKIASEVTKKRQALWKPRKEVGSVSYFSTLEEVDLSKGEWLLLARNGYMLDELENHCLSQGFSFNSVNRDPLKSPALAAIKIWENLRRGLDESAEHILEVLKYMAPAFYTVDLFHRLKGDEASRQYGLPELKRLGLRTDQIWHQSLTKISTTERDFFIAARRRNEPLLKKPRIKISTIHASKGGEADNVLLMSDMSYRCFCNMQEEFDDEARVWYVAATRCFSSLNIILPRTNLSFDL